MSSALVAHDESGPVGTDPDMIAGILDVLHAAADHGEDEALLREHFEGLRSRHRDCRIDLLVDREAYDGRAAFDVLIRDRSGRTISLSVSDPVGLPWPLRGVARASEYDLLQVNGTKMSVQEALSSIDAIFDDRHVLRSLIDACLLGDAIDDAELEVTAAQLEDASDSFRRARGLQTAAATTGWLERRSLSLEQFAIMIEQQAKIAKLRELLFGRRADRELRSNSTGSGMVQVAWVTPPRGDNACAIELAADPLTAIVAARRERRPAGLEQWQSQDVPVRFGEMLTTNVGDVVELQGGSAGDSLVLAVVIDREPAADRGREREALLRRLFDEWLTERRLAARVQWFWGNEKRTAPAVLERQP